MITKELIKAEVEKVKDDYLEMLYKIVKIFEAPPEVNISYEKTTTRVVEKDEFEITDQNEVDVGYSAIDQLVGLCETGKTDASIAHDRIIYSRRGQE